MNFSIQGDEFISKKYQTTMPDGSVWEIPILIIALNRAQYYAELDDTSLNESLNQDTIPLFEDPDEVDDWARNNMDWDEVKGSAIQISPPKESDYQDGWLNPDDWKVV